MDPVLKGALIGFSIAAPVGPVGLLCIRRSLHDGRLAGFVTGMGAATADTLYGLVAAFGLTALTTFLAGYREAFQLVGGLFLVYLGIAALRTKPSVTTAARPAANLLAAYFSPLAITAANPVTIAAFVGIFAATGLGATQTEPSTALRLVLGVFIGSAAWWLILSTGASAFAPRIQSGGLHKLNLIAGFALVVFGLWQLAQLV